MQKKPVKKPHSPTAHNRKAGFDVAIEKTYEAGIALTGDEIKSIRANRAQLTGSYVKLLGDRSGNRLPEVVLVGLHLSQAPDPERTRRLLLHAHEIREIQEALQVKGRAAVATRIEMRRGWAKVHIGVGTGRKSYDKRELLKKRDVSREIEADLKRRP